MDIKEISIITAQGAKTYRRGEKVNGTIINVIKIAPLYFTGDPFDHYIGYSANNEMLFSINCLAPVEVVYNS